MATRSQITSNSSREAAHWDGTTEARVLQAFLVQLEQRGLVQGAGPDARHSVRRWESAAKASGPAEIENAVRKLIEVLRDPT